MRTLLCAIGVIISAWSMSTRPSEALIVYQWCASYSGAQGAVNCGFATYQQCAATVSGIGGSCYQNPMYNPPPDSAPAPRRAKSRNQQ